MESLLIMGEWELVLDMMVFGTYLGKKNCFVPSPIIL